MDEASVYAVESPVDESETRRCVCMPGWQGGKQIKRFCATRRPVRWKSDDRQLAGRETGHVIDTMPLEIMQIAHSYEIGSRERHAVSTKLYDPGRMYGYGVWPIDGELQEQCCELLCVSGIG